MPPVIKTSNNPDIQVRVDDRLTDMEDNNLPESLDKTNLELISANRDARSLVAAEIRLEREKERSGEDELTGLLNRKGFNKELKKRINLRQKTGGKLTAIFIDANGLKEINDTKGHEAGDEYLKLIASELRNSTRVTDVVARFGGDEFAIVLDNPNEKSVEGWWDRYSKNSQTRISAGGVLLSMTDPDSSLAKADEAMYAAKLNKKDGKSHLMIVEHDGNFAEYFPKDTNGSNVAA